MFTALEVNSNYAAAKLDKVNTRDVFSNIGFIYLRKLVSGYRDVVKVSD